jgi:hypothetical protein
MDPDDIRVLARCLVEDLTVDHCKRRALHPKIQQMLLDQYLQTFLPWTPTQQVAPRKRHRLRRDGTLTWHYKEIW